ncbi:GNAT family N-acetyltransferase [Streptomyces sp. MST-110588]|uniref:GNAT family N-acetyltransferase n=1 Tax=Streptomyces sp. MST-110588 TaxID=2833628 RepID=UPI001F5C22B2|nr:GNAT family N-acetyltransferase [Streptomyces sp. MST-110588]UNO43238.1 GNAT family N-acetyltransferase [Streptomyces sp. MST-110588]
MTLRTAAAPPATPTARLTATLCQDPERFAALAAPWEELRRRSPAATPFQSHTWLHSWWLSYGRPGRLRIVLVHRGGDELVAAAPLMLTRRPLPTLVPLGGGISDFGDVLLAEDCPQAAHALAHGLRSVARGAVVDLREVRPGGAAERLYDAWRGPRRTLPDSVSLELPGVPMEDLLRRLATASAKRTRGKLRRIDTLGIHEHTVGEHEVPAAVRTLLHLHELQWRGRGVTPEHLRPRFRAHLQRAAQGMVRAGEAVLTEYRLGPDVMAADIAFISRGLVCGYLYGAHPELRARKVDIATLLLRRNARHAAAGPRTLSLLRGTEPYKMRWQPTEVAHQRILLARRELAPLLSLHAAQVAGRALAADAVRAHAPTAQKWLTRLNGRPTRGTAV